MDPLGLHRSCEPARIRIRTRAQAWLAGTLEKGFATVAPKLRDALLASALPTLPWLVKAFAFRWAFQ